MNCRITRALRDCPYMYACPHPPYRSQRWFLQCQHCCLHICIATIHGSTVSVIGSAVSINGSKASIYGAAASNNRGSPGPRGLPGGCWRCDRFAGGRANAISVPGRASLTSTQHTLSQCQTSHNGVLHTRSQYQTLHVGAPQCAMPVPGTAQSSRHSLCEYRAPRATRVGS